MYGGEVCGQVVGQHPADGQVEGAGPVLQQPGPQLVLPPGSGQWSTSLQGAGCRRVQGTGCTLTVGSVLAIDRCSCYRQMPLRDF